MNRIEFMGQLETLLQDIPVSERSEAIQYYNDYFDDAGSENEGKIIEQLNSPQKVAAIIKAGLNEEENTTGEFTEKGYQDTRFETRQEVMNESIVDNSQYDKRKEEKWGPGKIALIVILCVLAIPVGIPLVASAGGILIGILGAVFGILLGIFCTTAALLITGIVLFGIGIAQIFVTPATGLGLIGAGLIVLAIGILFLILCVWIITQGIPFGVKGIKILFYKIFPKKGGSNV